MPPRPRPPLKLPSYLISSPSNNRPFLGLCTNCRELARRTFYSRSHPRTSSTSSGAPIRGLELSKGYLANISQPRNSSSSSTRWKSRQGRDSFAREAKVQGLKSRAAFKLLEIDARYRIFRRGQTVVDLGYAPGSWSQVAVERTKPRGRILGIDIIPAQPPKGVSTIQGNFLSAGVRAEVKRFLEDPERGRPIRAEDEQLSYLEMERHAFEDTPEDDQDMEQTKEQHESQDGRTKEKNTENTVDVVLSDMCAPWEQTAGFWKRSLSDPYRRMMNTTGIKFSDHAGSMDLCQAALRFAYDTLKPGGHFVCKFYQGSEDKDLERQLKKLFGSVHREKPESSRSESKEAFFVALRRKDKVGPEDMGFVDAGGHSL